jgi:hypothetical protein
MKIIRYSGVLHNQWNEFVKSAKNGHFIFLREYLEYHSERFVDHSLLVFDDKKRLVAILPANITGKILFSHQGLTFGGFVVGRKVTTQIMLDIFYLLVEYLNSIQINKLIYKPLPHIYAVEPAQEDLYALSILGALLVRRDVSSTINLNTPVKYSKGRKWTINKAKKENLELCQLNRYGDFWELLNKVLAYQHNVKATHSITEIEYLHDCFPENIKLFVVENEGKLMAGTVIYETTQVAHTQYLANSDKGREIGALDFLIDHLIKNVYKDKKYFDFGISTEEEGRFLNKGLIAQKEGFGAKATVFDHYELEIIN